MWTFAVCVAAKDVHVGVGLCRGYTATQRALQGYSAELTQYYKPCFKCDPTTTY